MAAFTLGIASLSHAEVVLPKVIDSHMILQRGVDAPVWGWADQGEAVTVEFSGQSKTATPDASGKWMVKLDPLTASAESRAMEYISSARSEHSEYPLILIKKASHK